MIYERYGVIRTDSPDQGIVSDMLNCAREADKDKEVLEEKQYKRFWEVYYYVYYGLYSYAWKGINEICEEYRWRIPGSVYHFLERFVKKPR